MAPRTSCLRGHADLTAGSSDPNGRVEFLFVFDSSFWRGLRWHSVLKDKQAIQSNPMEGKRVGVDPYIAFPLLSC